MHFCNLLGPHLAVGLNSLNMLVALEGLDGIVVELNTVINS
jgi:hypothetical protein